MKRLPFVLIPFCLIAFLSITDQLKSAEKETEQDPQYELDNNIIPGASEKELVLKNFSTNKALEYVELGAKAWTKNNSCISCHTNGTYLFVRPALTKQLGKPSQEIKSFYSSYLKEFQKKPLKKIKVKNYPGEVIYLASGLSEWDSHFEKETSAETAEALKLMFSIQMKNGSWDSATCWPPFESSSYQLATMAIMAAGTAPGWLAQLKDPEQLKGLKNLGAYLRKTVPPHDYAKVLLLWASTRFSNLINNQQQKEIVEMIWKKQHSDGGWAMRDFAKPEEWGQGNRASKLKKEQDFKNPSSDGHQTGLALVVLRDSGIPADDPRIQKAVRWLKTNQRVSGRWWTRSLNTEGTHYITYSSTCYALLALSKCNALPPLKKETTVSK
jgi:squalene-hopene/tetraprenyl-beta-curcumene cyclase